MLELLITVRCTIELFHVIAVFTEANFTAFVPFQIYLRAKETVFIPFRYQSFEADHKVAVQGPSHFKTTPTSLQPVRISAQSVEPKLVKVCFLLMLGTF